MARPKKNKTSEEIVREVFEKDADEARKARIALAEKLKQSQEPDEAVCREKFRVFWASNWHGYKRARKDLEEAVWLHLKAIKKIRPEMFEEGIKHFGLIR